MVSEVDGGVNEGGEVWTNQSRKRETQSPRSPLVSYFGYTRTLTLILGSSRSIMVRKSSVNLYPAPKVSSPPCGVVSEVSRCEFPGRYPTLKPWIKHRMSVFFILPSFLNEMSSC